MKSTEIRNFLISALKSDADPSEISARLEEKGISYDFNSDFTEKVLGRIYSSVLKPAREVDFVRSLNFAFYRIALTGVAAIVVLLISIFLMEGSLSFNSFLGLSDSYDETIVSLLTGN